MALLLHGDDLTGLCQQVRQGPDEVPAAEIAPGSSTTGTVTGSGVPRIS